MDLAFSQFFPNDKPGIAGQPTHFFEKIWSSIYDHFETIDRDAENEFIEMFGEGSHPGGESNLVWMVDQYQPKIHTIRRDETQRWKPGMDIDFWMNHRTPQQFRIAPRIPMIDKEPIRIRHRQNGSPNVWVSGVLMNRACVERLAFNDGFESTEDFFSWFCDDFDGWILHWTPNRYWEFE